MENKNQNSSIGNPYVTANRLATSVKFLCSSEEQQKYAVDDLAMLVQLRGQASNSNLKN